MRTFITAVILGASIVAQAQGVVARKPGKWALGVSFSPDYSYRRLIIDRDDPKRREYAEELDAQDKPILGVTAGFNIQRKLGKNFSLETGLLFSQQGLRHVEKNIDYSSYTWIVPPGDLPKDIDLTRKLQFIDAPIRLNFAVGGGKIRFTSSVALNVNYQFGYIYSRTSTYDDGSVKSTRDRYAGSYLAFGGQVSAGMNYAINSKSNLRIEPTFRYRFPESHANSTPYNCGLNISYFIAL